MRILVAENDRDFIELIKSSLLNAGDQYQVETVSSGADCLKTSRCFESVDLSSWNKLNSAEKGRSPPLRNSMIIKRTGWAIALMIFTLDSASEKVIIITCPFRPCMVGVYAN